MKILGFTFRKLEKEHTTINSVETWMVEWSSIYQEIGRFWHPKTEIMAFISKADAEGFARELKDAARLLKNSNQGVKVYKQVHSSNL